MSEQENPETQPTPETETTAASEMQEAPPITLTEPVPVAEPKLEDEASPAPTAESLPSEAAPAVEPEPVADTEVESIVAQELGELKDAAASIAEGVRLGNATTAKLDTRLTALEGRMERLAADFAARLRFDAVKDEVISNQSKELDGFRRGVVAKELGAIIDNLIFEIDGTRRIAKRLATQEPTEANYRKVIEALIDGAEALEDSVLSRVSVKSFTTSEGSPFDTAKHVLSKDAHEDTQDRSKDGLVAKSVRCGYERTVAAPDGQTKTVVVRPEQVAVWRFAEEIAASQAVPVASAMPDATPPLQAMDTPVEAPTV